MGNTNRAEHKKAMYGIIEQWKASGLTQKGFCQEHHLSLSTLQYWNKRYRNEKRTVNGFVPLRVEYGTLPEGHNIEIIYPNGVCLRLSAHTSSSMIGELVRMY